MVFLNIFFQFPGFFVLSNKIQVALLHPHVMKSARSKTVFHFFAEIPLYWIKSISSKNLSAGLSLPALSIRKR